MRRNATLVTGAGRGIGLEIAKKFASEKHNLVLIIRKKNQKKNIRKIKESF